MQPADVHAEINLSNVHPGLRTFDLTAQQIHLPLELEVVQVVPSQFQLTFDTRSSRQVEVHPRVIGTFANEYHIARVMVDPPKITITGPKSRVDAVESAITDPVDASGTMDRGTFTTTAYVSDPLIQVVNPGPIHVTVIMEKVSGKH
jgi:YbbR domain-containing protein